MILTVCYGMGVDSTALLVELVRRRERPHYILFANTGGEQVLTYAYLGIINEYLRDHRFPEVTVVQYTPTDFKNWPPYHSLEENCLTNGTLPSLAFGFKSCSQKWKQTPQDSYLKQQPDVQAEWQAGRTVMKYIGYDASPQDLRRRNHIGDIKDKRYTYRYPLIEWGWTRERCIEEIEQAGLPVPFKSACFFCPAMKPYEVDLLPPDKLRRIVMMEARALPRLQSVHGLWRTPVKGTRGATPKPGAITDYIIQHDLLPAEHVAWIFEHIPQAIIRNQERYAAGEAIPSWPAFFAGLDRIAPWRYEEALRAESKTAATWRDFDLQLGQE